jgi:anti-anti-sigma factor
LITTQIQGSTGLVKIDDRFTFQEYDAFKACTAGLLEGHGISEIDLDLSGATYMDSNALGMLVALKEKARPKSITVKLVRPSPSIWAILEMVQFEQLFPILR